MVRIIRIAALLGLLFPGLALQAQEQDAQWDPLLVSSSRAALEDLLSRYDAAARSQAYTAGLRASARQAAARIRIRLVEGDFQIGDRVYMFVEGEETLSDTFTVAPGQILQLVEIDDVPLRGVLRSELHSYLMERIGRSIRDPVIRSQALIRISFIGQVGAPGFHSLPPELPIGDAIMRAGGPTDRGAVDGLRVVRSGQIVLQGEILQTALQEGRTLDELDIHSGDQIIVPGAPLFSAGQIFRVVAVASTTIFAVSRLFR